ncbi:MAG: hypothetical protein ACE5JU_24995 [Candidatus Binatia bacterium]
MLTVKKVATSPTSSPTLRLRELIGADISRCPRCKQGTMVIVAELPKLRHHNPMGVGVVSNIDHYRWSSHYGYLNKRKAPKWLNTESILSRFGRSRNGLLEYQKFMHSEIEQEIQEYYSKPYFKPVLGSREFVRWVMERIGHRGEVHGEKPESR